MNNELRITNTLILLPLFFILYSLFPTHVSAHVLQTDGSIGAVLHVDPEDDPIVGEQTGFYFEFKDKENKFKPSNCDCQFLISKAGQEVLSQPLFQDSQNASLESATLFYTFPERNVYKIQVVGKPTDGSFQPFTLTFDMRVERGSLKSSETSPSWLSTHTPHLFLGGTIGIFLIFVFIRLLRKKS